MSSKKRRAKRKIAQLVRMDKTRQRMTKCTWDDYILGIINRQQNYICCMAALGGKLRRMGLMQRAVEALKASGSTIRGL